MKLAILYHSQTGFTRQYVDWIAEKTHADCYSLTEAIKADLSACDVLLLGSWMHAGSIYKLNKLAAIAQKYPQKPVLLFCTGASPIASPDSQKALEAGSQLLKIDPALTFYCPGGLNYDQMSPGNRLLMKAFASMVKAKKNKTEDEKLMSEMIVSSYDISDSKAIEPILVALSAIETKTTPSDLND